MAPAQPKDLKSIETFRADSRYAADGTRIDLAYAVYALAHGATRQRLPPRSGHAI